MITGKIDLLALKVVRRTLKTKSGEVDCVIIPIEANRLYVGKQSISLSFVGFELKNKKYDDTHIIKQSFSKKERENMSEEELKNLPILGNLRVSESDFSKAGEVVDIDPDTDLDDVELLF